MVTFDWQLYTDLFLATARVGSANVQNITSPFVSTKILNHMDRLGEFLQEDKRFQINPITVEIHPTNRCNLKCRDCTFQAVDRRMEMDSPTLLKSVQEIIDLKTVKAIVWSGGGEPTLHKSLLESITLFGQAGLEQGIASNGTRITDEFTEIAVKYLTYCRISLNAASRSGYLEMHGSDQYGLLQANIGRLRRKRDLAHLSKCTLGSSFLIYPENIQDVLQAIQNAVEWGLDYLQIKPAVLNRQNYSSTYLSDFYHILSTLAIKPSRTTIIVDTDKFGDLQCQDFGRTYSMCWGALFYATIAADKNIYICCHKVNDRNASFGNLEKKTFREIWFSRRKKDVIQSVDVSQCPPNCKFHKMNKILQEVYDSQFIRHQNFL
jgi:GTP 3',8-cyclase